MTDKRFYTASGPFTLHQLAETCGAEIGEDVAADALYHDVAPLDDAGAKDVSFFDNKLYAESFAASSAGACLVHPSLAGKAPKGMALLLCGEPYRGYAKVARLFYPAPRLEPVISRSAIIEDTAVVGEGCRVDAGAYISHRVEIGANCHIGANVAIGEGVVIGGACLIKPNATLAYCILGARVTIHAGARIGQDGFGFALGPEGHLKVPQLGRVIIEDDVEIGANATIDRGSGPDTLVGAGTKIDNLVQLAHNVKIGRGCVIVSQVGISGSTNVGDGAIMAGQAGLTGHLTIGAGAKIAAQSGVMRDVEPGEEVGGSPAKPVREWLKGVATLERIVRKKGG
ncbi:MAG TPA: UDP-3-O-(3-hydroxymyristoyl)glucosamine N-acyltransferase [Rhodospirillales bacterium]|mgnify:CR=1 FL=1|nr:UDP-3-O-(3-hydroxymyristoyl)glucosamine N-acyltransferase [Rhodospirillales bacterium]